MNENLSKLPLMGSKECSGMNNAMRPYEMCLAVFQWKPVEASLPHSSSSGNHGAEKISRDDYSRSPMAVDVRLEDLV